MKQHLMLTLLAIAGTLTFGQLLTAQLPGGPPNKVRDLRGNGMANSQIQSQIQQQVQEQVQRQIQAQATARMQADVNRAADLAQRAAATAQRQASAAQQRIAGSARIKLSAKAFARGEQRNERGMLEANGHAQASARLRLPPGFAEADVELYDRIFGKHNPIRAQKPGSNQASGVDTERGTEKGMKIRAVNYEETGTDLAAQIHLAIQHRRAEISELRDRALVETRPELLEQADQMELVMDTFVEAQARAKAKAEAHANADAKASVEIENRLNSRGNSTPGPNRDSIRSIDQAGEVESSSESRMDSETNGSIRGKHK